MVRHIFDSKEKKLSIDELLLDAMKKIWGKALENEFGRLSNGIPKELLGMNTISFILKSSIPQG